MRVDIEAWELYDKIALLIDFVLNPEASRIRKSLHCLFVYKIMVG